MGEQKLPQTMLPQPAAPDQNVSAVCGFVDRGRHGVSRLDGMKTVSASRVTCR